MNREAFGLLFKVGEEIDSGGPPERSNAARLLILSIEEVGVRYKSIRSKTAKLLPYSTLDVVLAGFERIDARAIQRTIQPVYLDAGLRRNVFTENYEYGIAREFRRRQEWSALRGSTSASHTEGVDLSMESGSAITKCTETQLVDAITHRP